MIIPDEEIMKFRLYGYHLTTSSKLRLIKNEGLLPKLGNRSKSIGEVREAIYFFPALILIDHWIKLLYKNRDKSSLELLRIDLHNLNFTVTDEYNDIFGDWYTLNPISPEKIELLKKINSNGEHFLLENILEQDANSLIWKPISSIDEKKLEYKK